ncbi:MAG: glycoside hydrolase family 29, partial [Bacteroidales bacterium]|nr:glycoside hydrolase family 29 [Bacteroidales bacterium]
MEGKLRGINKFYITLSSRLTANNYRQKSRLFTTPNVADRDKNTYWTTDGGVKNDSSEIKLSLEHIIKYIVILKFIKLGHRVKSFNIEVLQNRIRKKIATGTTIGYKRIVQIDPVITQKVRINIIDSRACPVI